MTKKIFPLGVGGWGVRGETKEERIFWLFIGEGDQFVFIFVKL